MTTRKTAEKEGAEARVGATVGSRTAAVDLTSGSKLIKFHTPPSETVPEIGTLVTGTGVGASAVVAASPAPTSEQFYVTVNSSATSSNVTATFAAGGAPEQAGTLEVTTADALAAGYFGSRNNTHSDDEYTLPNLSSGASPGDWDNAHDAPGGQNLGYGSY